MRYLLHPALSFTGHSSRGSGQSDRLVHRSSRRFLFSFQDKRAVSQVATSPVDIIRIEWSSDKETDDDVQSSSSSSSSQATARRC